LKKLESFHRGTVSAIRNTHGEVLHDLDVLRRGRPIDRLIEVVRRRVVSLGRPRRRDRRCGEFGSYPTFMGERRIPNG